MTTWLLEGFNTDRRYSDDVRYRAYTTSKRKAAAFSRIPKIQFTDSGHGIVFSATELPRRTRKLEPRYGLDEYVREHMRAEEERQKGLDKPSVLAVRDRNQDALIRVLTMDEAHGQYACCCWRDCSDAVPCFRLAAPIGHRDYCRDHIDEAIASLGPDWIRGWEYREPVPVTGGDDDIPF